jgi:hypothetical protein
MVDISLIPVLSLVQAALTIWLFIDAYRRQSDSFWPWVILFVQPIGAWIYFFAVKLGDLGLGSRGLNYFHRGPSLEELRYRAEHVPTLSSHLDLAERLIEMDEHENALPYLDSALKREPDHCQVLYLLAVCYTALEQPDRAVPLLEKINTRDRCWKDYSAWRLLVEARDALNDRAGALVACRELVRLSPTLRNKCLLADHLFSQGLLHEARALLERALEDYRYSPSNFRWRNRHWAGEARRICKQLAALKIEDRG